MSLEQRPADLNALTGLRAIAALLVVAYHFGRTWWSEGPAPLQTVLGHGSAAVGLFFFLSGFILTTAYVLADRLKPADRRRYYVARFARVYPLFVASLAFMAGFGLLDGMTPDRLLAQLLLLHAWLFFHESYVSVGNFPSWSLSAEAFFYLLLPLLPFEALRRLPASLLALAGAATWLVSMLALTMLVQAGPHLPPKIYHHLWFFLPLVHLTTFLAGIWTGLLFGKLKGDGLRSARWLWLPELGLIAIYGSMVLALRTLPSGAVFIHDGFLVPGFVLLVLGLAWRLGPLSRLLGSRLFVLLGKASYAIYLLHVPLWYLAAKWRLRDLVGNPAFEVYFTGYVLTLIVLSVLAYRFIEQPARDGLQALFSRRAPDAAQPSS